MSVENIPSIETKTKENFAELLNEFMDKDGKVEQTRSKGYSGCD